MRCLVFEIMYSFSGTEHRYDGKGYELNFFISALRLFTPVFR